MNIEELVDLQDCPLCDGPAYLEEEANSFYVMCYECGCHSVTVNYKKVEDRLLAAQGTAKLWNSGKVIKPTPGE